MNNHRLFTFVLKRVLQTSDGRDKILKIIQYLAKVYLLSISTPNATKTATNTTRTTADTTSAAPINDTLTTPINATLTTTNNFKYKASNFTSHISNARKIIRLGHAIEGITDFIDFCTATDKNTSQLSIIISKKTSLNEKIPLLLSLIGCIIGIINDLSDDIVALAKMKILDSSWSTLCTPISDRLWYSSIFMDLYANLSLQKSTRHSLLALMKMRHSLSVSDIVSMNEHGEMIKNQKDTQLKINEQKEIMKKKIDINDQKEIIKKIRALEEKLFMQRISLLKLGADWIFCTFDVFNLAEKGFPDSIQVFSGLLSALLGSYKIYVKQAT